MPNPTETTPAAQQVNPNAALNAFYSRTTEMMKQAEGGTPPPPPPEPTDEPTASPVEETEPASAQAPEPATKDAKAEPQPAQPTATDKWPRTAEQWKKFTAARDQGYKERDDKIATLTQQISDLNARTAEASTTKELEAIRKERDELSEKLAMLNVVEHPKFKAYYEGKRNEQVDVAKRILGDRAQQFEQIIAMPDSQWKDEQLTELVADMTPIQQGRVAAIVNELSRLDTEKANQIANWKQNREALQAEEFKQKQAAEAKQAEFAKQMTGEFESHLSKMQDKTDGIVAFQKREGDEAWNSAVDKRIEYARALFNGKVDKKGALQAIVNAAAFDGVLQHAIALQQEVEKLNGMIKGMQASNPTIRASGQTPPADDGSNIKAGMRPGDVTNAFLKSLRQRAEG